MKDFNDLGISRRLDWPRIRKLLAIGLVAALLHLTADLLLAWDRKDEALDGIMRMLSAYAAAPDGRIFAAALLGLFGVVLEGLSCFGIYHLMAEKTPKLLLKEFWKHTLIIAWIVKKAKGVYHPWQKNNSRRSPSGCWT